MISILEILDREIERRHEHFLKLDRELSELRTVNVKLKEDNDRLKQDIKAIAQDFIKYKQDHK